MSNEQTTHTQEVFADQAITAAASNRICPKCGLEVARNIKFCPEDGADLTASSSPISPLADRYEFISAVGSGGVGIVYKARQKLLNKLVAVKMLQAQLPSPSATLRFQREGQAASRLCHPNLIGVHDFGVTEDGRPFMVLDWADGRDLARVLLEEGRLSVKESIELFIQLCDGLSHAHNQGVLHRDLKPSNIMFVRDANGNPGVKILDFGIAKFMEAEEQSAAKLTQTGEAVGSPLYMSPEQGLGKNVDARSDLYSLGCVMFEVLTGTPPFVADTVVSTFLKHQTETPMSLKEATLGQSFPEGLELIVARLLCKQPDERYQSAEALKADLEIVRSGSGALPNQGNTATASKSRRPLDRKMALLTSAVAGVVVLAALVMCYILYVDGQQTSVPPTVLDMTSSVFSPMDNVLRKDSEVEQRVKDNPHIIMTVLHGGEITNKGLEYLEAAKILKDLCILKTKVDDEGCKHLVNLPLHSLMLDCSRVKDGAFESIGKIYSLKKLSLEKCDIDGSGFDALQPLHKLVSLNLGGTHVTDGAMSKLKCIDQLEVLDLSYTNIGDEGIASVANNMRSLTTLSLRGAKISSRGLSSLAQLPDLSALDLGSSDFSNEDLRALTKLKGLAILNLRKDKLTDQGLVALAQLPELKSINLTECKQITRKGIEKFHAMRPTVELTLSDMQSAFLQIETHAYHLPISVANRSRK